MKKADEKTFDSTLPSVIISSQLIQRFYSLLHIQFTARFPAKQHVPSELSFFLFPSWVRGFPIEYFMDSNLSQAQFKSLSLLLAFVPVQRAS